VFIVTYPEEYYKDLSKTPEWFFVKGIVDAISRRGVKEEEA